MKARLLVNGYEKMDWHEGLPFELTGYALPQAHSYYATGEWGIICVQEIETAGFSLRHFLFSLQKIISLSIQEHSQGLQALLSLKGSFGHQLPGRKPMHFQEREYLLFRAPEEQVITTAPNTKLYSLLNAQYASDIYRTLLPLFRGLKNDLRKPPATARYFLHVPRYARYSVHDAIHAIWLDRYVPSLAIKHIELRLESTLFTLLAQTYATPTLPSATALEKEQAAAARELILQDITKHFTIEEIAAQLYCSSAWLKSAFRKVYGTGLFHFLRRTRMERAKEMLLRGESLKAVALEVGMKPSNFPKEFKAFFGYTVTALKKGQI